MTEIKQIGISDLYVSDATYHLRTSGLGSCVGVILYDKVNKIGGLSHIMLPESPKSFGKIDIKKYCDTNLPFLLSEMKRLGATALYIKGAIFGGAEMFTYQNNPLMNIGKRNVEAASSFLKSKNIPILFQDVGGKKGRTIQLDITNGEITLRTAYESPKTYNMK